MHGLGNDYVYVDCTAGFDVDDPPALARAVSDRHTGIGSDGLILIRSADDADVRMEMYNADGSRGRMCGNGIRCVAKYVVDRGIVPGPEVRVATDGGVKSLLCHLEGGKVASVRVDMGTPAFDPREIPARIQGDRIVEHPLELGGRRYRVTCLSMGNPHAVVFVEDLEAIDLAAVGPRFEYAPIFPERINAHFARVDDRAHVTVKTWERGSGATRACGTGACACAVAAALTGRTDRRVVSTLPGGDLEIEWTPDDHVHMTGPAVEVFTGEWPD
jgi:diaminopimelate epimerase